MDCIPVIFPGLVQFLGKGYIPLTIITGSSDINQQLG